MVKLSKESQTAFKIVLRMSRMMSCYKGSRWKSVLLIAIGSHNERQTHYFLKFQIFIRKMRYTHTHPTFKHLDWVLNGYLEYLEAFRYRTLLHRRPVGFIEI